MDTGADTDTDRDEPPLSDWALDSNLERNTSFELNAYSIKR